MEKIIISKREFDVLELLAAGLTNKEIAEKLCVTINTVTTHINSIYSKSLIDSYSGCSVARLRCALKYFNNEYKVKLYYGKDRKVNNGRKCN